MDLGPTGETVAANLARIRMSRGLNYTELSKLLDQAGREISALGIRRAESGERRLDVDDLTALAVVLGVSPLTLLLPEDGRRGASSRLTGIDDRKVAHNTQWLWGLGEQPLSLPGLGATEEAQRAIARFELSAKPAIEPRSASYIVDRPIDRAPEEDDDEDLQIHKDHARRTQREANIAQGLVPMWGQGLDKYDVEALEAEVRGHGND